MRKLALSAGDGGLQGAFIAGAMDALYQIFDLAEVKVFAASSASVAGLFYYLSHGREHPGRRVWTEELSSPDFCGIRSLGAIATGRPLYNMGFLIESIFRGKYPYNIERIAASEQEFYFPVLNYETMSLEYFSNTRDAFIEDGDEQVAVHDFRSYDLYQVIKAAMSAPVLVDQTVTLGSVSYLDGGLLRPYVVGISPMHDLKTIVIATHVEMSHRMAVDFEIAGLVWSSIKAASTTCWHNDSRKR